MRRVSPAARVLMDAGVTLRQVAERMGVSDAAVSTMLTGRVGAHPRLVPTVRELAGDDVADRLAGLLPRGRVRMLVSEGVQELRRHGVTVHAVAAEAGVEDSKVYRVLRGVTGPDLAVRDAIGRIAGDDVADEVWSLIGAPVKGRLPNGWVAPPKGWSAGNGLAACQTCGRPTTMRDPLGYGRHVECVKGA